MNTYLQELVRDMDEAAGRVRRLADSLTEEDWLGRHPKGGWSPSECIVHLNLTAREMVPRVRSAIERGRREGVRGEGPYSMDLLGRLLCWSIEPPYRLRFRTAAAFQPGATAPRPEVIDEFERGHDTIVACIREAEGLDLSRLKIVSPFDARVKYSLYATFRIVAAHLRRHVWQAEQTVAARRGELARAERRHA